MGIGISKPLSVCGINLNFAMSPFRTSFGNGYDAFENTSPARFTTEEYIKKAINTNPKIKTILKEMNAPVKINTKELKDLTENHAKKTQIIATGIISKLPKGLREHVNIKSVKEASYLHDIGKALIPAEILNKNGALSDKEKELMHRHSELGYEILKNSDIDTRTLHLVKYHHQNPTHDGYPKVPSDFFADINLQILSASDKYSALTEERVYKPAYNRQQALAIIYKDVQAGNLHPFIFKALKEHTETIPEKTTAQIKCA